MSFVDGFEAGTIHGQDPQTLIEKIIRLRITETAYWKEHCFGLSAETIVDKAAALTHVGGCISALLKPTEFLCLTLRLLQLQPDRSVIAVYLQNEEYKYLTALAAFYVRLTFRSKDVYEYLEPLLLDKRKLRMRGPNGNFYLSYMDEFADNLLREDRVCETILPRLTRRTVLVEAKDLEERISPLEEELDMMEEDSEREAGEEGERNGGDHDVEETMPSEETRPSEASASMEKKIEAASVSTVNRESVDQATETRNYDIGGLNKSREHENSSQNNVSRDRERDSHRWRDSHGERSRDRDRGSQRVFDEDERIVHRREQRNEEFGRRESEARPKDRDLDRRERRNEDGLGALDEEKGLREIPSSTTEDFDRKKKKFSSKKVNALFKKSKDSATQGSKKDGEEGGAAGGSKESMSIEETNKMRLALGLKPLKQ